MPAPFIIPFNFQPVSTSQKTASYTIPAGKYAYIKTISPSLTLDGVQLYPSASTTLSSGSAVNASSSIPVLSGAYVYSANGSSSTNPTFKSYSYGTGTSGSVQVVVGSRIGNGALANGFIPGTLLNLAITNSASDGVAGVLTVSYYYFPASGANDFWVQSGTILNGNNYIVTEYNSIT